MIGPTPRYCRPRAFEQFGRQLAELDQTAGLIGTATAIAMHAHEDVYPGIVQERLEALAVTVRRRARSGSRRALMAHLHEVLFEEQRFEGNKVDYYDPANSYLPQVLASRRGIPISLALVYKAVAELVGLAVCGIGAPGHFLVRVEDEDGPLLVDPFHRGRVLSREDAFQLMEGTLGAPVPRSSSLLQPVTHQSWIERMLRNLAAIHARRARPRDSGAMKELLNLLEAGPAPRDAERQDS